MKCFYKVLLSTVLLPILSYAQSNYKPGYVINLKGDTLKGFIDYREWGTNPDAISFKTTVSDRDPQKFTTADISTFSITGLEKYQSYTGAISMDNPDKDHLSSQRDTSSRVATVFLRILQNGKNISVYSYTDALKLRLFFGETPGFKPQELVYRLYYNTGGQSGTTVTENTYMKQLYALANKYGILNSSLQWDIEHMGYNENDVLKIAGRINNLSKDDLKKAGGDKGPIFNIFVGAGFNSNQITTNQASAFYAGGGRSYTSAGFAANAGLNFFVNPSTRQFQFRIEAGVAQSQFKSMYQLKVSPYVPFEASFNELALTISPQLLYNFYNAENLKIYGSVGLAFNFFTFSNPYLGSQSRPNSAADIEANEPYLFNSTDNGFVFKVGAQFNKHWGIYGQYLTGASLTNQGYFMLSSTCEQVGVNYYFW
ncbi:MAG TPA: hypothetical protein VIM89_00725 [Mucilaginibacter sp.]